MALQTKDLGDVAVVIPEGTLSCDPEATALDAELRRILDEGRKKILLDLRNTTHLGSKAIGVLAGFHTTAVRREARFAVCNVERRIQSMLTIVRLVQVFDVYDTRDEALRDLGNGS